MRIEVEGLKVVGSRPVFGFGDHALQPTGGMRPQAVVRWSDGAVVMPLLLLRWGAALQHCAMSMAQGNLDVCAHRCPCLASEPFRALSCLATACCTRKPRLPRLLLASSIRGAPAAPLNSRQVCTPDGARHGGLSW